MSDGFNSNGRTKQISSLGMKKPVGMIIAQLPILNPPWPTATNRGDSKAEYTTVKANFVLAIGRRSIHDDDCVG